jgi:hypothetical protein
VIRVRFWDIVEIVGAIPGYLVCLVIWAPIRKGL